MTSWPSSMAMEQDSRRTWLKRSRTGCATLAKGMEEIYEWPSVRIRGRRVKWVPSSESARPSLFNVYRQRRTAARESPVALLSCDTVRKEVALEKHWMTHRPRASEVMKLGSPQRASICTPGKVEELGVRNDRAALLRFFFRRGLREIATMSIPSLRTVICRAVKDTRVEIHRAYPKSSLRSADTQLQTRRAVSTTRCSLAHCSSSVSIFPSMVEAKPHCGLSARFSSGTYWEASLIRWTSSSPLSILASLELTKPRTTVFPRGTKRSGSSVPERSSSYSSRNRSTASVPKSFSATAS